MAPSWLAPAPRHEHPVAEEEHTTATPAAQREAERQQRREHVSEADPLQDAHDAPHSSRCATRSRKPGSGLPRHRAPREKRESGAAGHEEDECAPAEHLAPEASLRPPRPRRRDVRDRWVVMPT